MSNNFTEELVFHLRALSRALYIVTEEEDVFLLRFEKLVKKFTSTTHVYSMATGMTSLAVAIRDWEKRTRTVNPATMSIHDALEDVYKADAKDQQSFYIFTDPEIHLSDPMVQRRVLDIMHQLHNDKNTVKLLIFLSSRKYVPTKLARYIQVIEDKGLSTEDIAGVLAKPCDALKIQVPPTPERLFRGMTSFEIEASLAQSVVLSVNDPQCPQDQVVPEHIHAYRRQQLKKTGLLEYVDTSSVTMADVGGVDRFKTWVKKTASVWTDEGQRYGLRVPKGVLLVGVWGTGKSLSAKMLGSQWKLPVVLLEMGKLRSSGVGDTEANAYTVTRMVESVAPCVLWIDEAEKSLSGGQSSAVSDSGTTARSLAIFSTWIAETKAPITLALTANRLSTLPVEFVNRMDEAWFFDLPSVDERIEILRIHLRKAGQDTDKYNLRTLSDAAKDMVGREIEQCVNIALIDSFDADKPCLDQAIMESVLRRKPRIVKTMTDEVKEIVDWVGYDVEADDGIKARFASKPNRGGDGKFRGGAFEIIQGGATTK